MILLSESVDPFVEILSVDPSCDGDEAFGFELVVQPPYDLIGIRGGDTELGGDFLYSHKLVFHKNLLSSFFVVVAEKPDQSIDFSCLVSEVLSGRHPICPGGLHHGSDAGGYSVARLNVIRLSQAHYTKRIC